MLGFRLSFQDNDSYAFRDRPAIREDTYWYEAMQTLTPNMSGASKPGVRRCPQCGELLAKWEEPLTGLRIKKRRYDISCTYDGVDVVSHRFKEVYEANGLTGLKFIPLPDDPDFFQIQATEIVPFDAEASGTRFGDRCSRCGQYKWIVTPRRVLKEKSTIPANGFVRTDLEFAGDDEKHPLLLCGQTAGDVLKAAKLKGLDLVPI
jgi:ribosomal protein S27AE